MKARAEFSPEAERALVARRVALARAFRVIEELTLDDRDCARVSEARERSERERGTAQQVALTEQARSNNGERHRG